MRAATEGNLPPVMPQGNLVEVLGREVRQGSPGELMVESSPSRQRQPPCETNKEMSDEAADAAALTYLLTYLLETKISLPGASNHGGSLDNLESNGLGPGAEMRRVEESTADRLTWAPESSKMSRSPSVPSGRVMENVRRTWEPLAVRQTWLSSMEASLRRSSDRDAQRTIAFGCGESGGTSALRVSGRWEEMAIAPGLGVAPAGHAWVQCPPQY